MRIATVSFIGWGHHAVAVMLDLVKPVRAAWRLGCRYGKARFNEAAASNGDTTGS
jgi:hypothetical protein